MIFMVFNKIPINKVFVYSKNEKETKHVIIINKI